MSLCNFCTLERIKRDAKDSAKKVITIRALDPAFGDVTDPIHMCSGPYISAHVVKEGENPSEENFVAWFLELPDHCCCDD